MDEGEALEVLTVRGVSAGYRGRRIVADISVALRFGDVLGLLAQWIGKIHAPESRSRVRFARWREQSRLRASTLRTLRNARRLNSVWRSTDQNCRPRCRDGNISNWLRPSGPAPPATGLAAMSLAGLVCLRGSLARSPNIRLARGRKFLSPPRCSDRQNFSSSTNPSTVLILWQPSKSRGSSANWRRPAGTR